jgi:hypothetical protein
MPDDAAPAEEEKKEEAATEKEEAAPAEESTAPVSASKDAAPPKPQSAQKKGGGGLPLWLAVAAGGLGGAVLFGGLAWAYTAGLPGFLRAPPGENELTKDTWDAKTGGKTVFVKFLAPW